MTVTISKLSLPDVWTKEFDSVHDAIMELRDHICGRCLEGYWEDSEPLDFEYEGKTIVCMDAGALLSTPCGCEYDIGGSHGLWPSDCDLEINAHRRVSRRKVSAHDLVEEQLAA